LFEKNFYRLLFTAPPPSLVAIRSFNYRRFIEGFSKIVKPLTTLLEKDREFKWTGACQASFEELKKWLTIILVLVMPDLQKSFDIYCDAS
jgi:hypothetical protein